jgi:hypothetical protein
MTASVRTEQMEHVCVIIISKLKQILLCLRLQLEIRKDETEVHR